MGVGEERGAEGRRGGADDRAGELPAPAEAATEGFEARGAAADDDAREVARREARGAEGLVAGAADALDEVVEGELEDVFRHGDRGGAAHPREEGRLDDELADAARADERRAGGLGEEPVRAGRLEGAEEVAAVDGEREPRDDVLDEDVAPGHRLPAHRRDGDGVVAQVDHADLQVPEVGADGEDAAADAGGVSHPREGLAGREHGPHVEPLGRGGPVDRLAPPPARAARDAEGGRRRGPVGGEPRAHLAEDGGHRALEGVGVGLVPVPAEEVERGRRLARVEGVVAGVAARVGGDGGGGRGLVAAREQQRAAFVEGGDHGARRRHVDGQRGRIHQGTSSSRCDAGTLARAGREPQGRARLTPPPQRLRV